MSTSLDLSRLTTLTVPQKVCAASTAVIAVAAFLPWVSVFGITMSGIRGNGLLTLLLSVAGATLIAVRAGVLKGGEKLSARRADIAQVVLGALVGLIALTSLNAAAGIGLFLTLAGGLGWVVAAAQQLRTSGSAVPSP